MIHETPLWNSFLIELKKLDIDLIKLVCASLFGKNNYLKFLKFKMLLLVFFCFTSQKLKKKYKIMILG